MIQRLATIAGTAILLAILVFGRGFATWMVASTADLELQHARQVLTELDEEIRHRAATLSEDNSDFFDQARALGHFKATQQQLRYEMEQIAASNPDTNPDTTPQGLSVTPTRLAKIRVLVDNIESKLGKPAPEMAFALSSH